MIRFAAICFLLATEIYGQYQQSSGCTPCQAQQQTQYSGSYNNGGTGYQYVQASGVNQNGYQNSPSSSQSGTYASNNGYQYSQAGQSQNGYQSSASSSQSGAYASNNGYQSGVYTNSAPYSSSGYNTNQQQQYGTSYNQGQQYGSNYNQAYQSNQYQGGSQSTGSQSSNNSEPGYLRDYKGDIYTNPDRIKETQALNAAFFQSIGGEPHYQGAVDGPQNSTSQSTSNSQGKK